MIQPLKIQKKYDNDDKLSQIIRENIPANQFTSADDINAILAKINEMVPAINVSNGGFQGTLSVNEKRVDSGFYIPQEDGVYINADDIVVDRSKGINFVTYDGDKWEVSVVPIIADGQIEEGNMGFVSGGEVYSDLQIIKNNVNYTLNSSNKSFSKHIKNLWINGIKNQKISKDKSFKISYFSYKTYYSKGISIQVLEWDGSKWVNPMDYNFEITAWEENLIVTSVGNTLSYYKLLIQLGNEPLDPIPLVSYSGDKLSIKRSALGEFYHPNVLNFNSGKFVTVGRGQMYDNIQDALDNIYDSVDNRVSIIVFPGNYPFFSTKKNVNRKRYINIFGINKKECCVVDESGDYYKSPGQMWFDGIVENMSFIATRGKEIDENNKLKSYGLHMDYGANHAVFKSCYFYSEQASAVGIGTFSNDYIEFQHCEMTSNISTDYFPFAYLPEYGGLWAHSQVGEAVNQNIVLKNCYVKGSGEYSMYLTCISSQWDFSKDVYAMLIGNSFANKDNIAKLRMEFKNSNLSHGNNNSNLNKLFSDPIL